MTVCCLTTERVPEVGRSDCDVLMAPSKSRRSGGATSKIRERRIRGEKDYSSERVILSKEGLIRLCGRAAWVVKMAEICLHLVV